MSNPIPPLVPFPEDGDREGVPQREVDGEAVIDEDANADDIDSATADRVAAQEPDETDDAV